MPQRIGLCIGINDYPGTGNDLSGCVNDARDWAQELQSRNFQVALLLDRRATRQAMATEMLTRVQAAQAGDCVVITYSGHGSYIPDVDGDEPDGTDEVLCPYDISQGNTLSDDELADIFSRRQAGARIVLISDSCHSGTVARFAPPIVARRGGRGAAAAAAAAAKVRFLPPETFLGRGRRRDGGWPLGMRSHVRPASPPGRGTALLLAGCQDTEFSYDASFGGRANGAFTYVALRALQSLSASARYVAWFRAIRQSLPTQQYPQSPNLYGTKSQKQWRVLQ